MKRKSGPLSVEIKTSVAANGESILHLFLPGLGEVFSTVLTAYIVDKQTGEQ
jgi:hypothetical protein